MGTPLKQKGALLREATPFQNTFKQGKYNTQPEHVSLILMRIKCEIERRQKLSTMVEGINYDY